MIPTRGHLTAAALATVALLLSGCTQVYTGEAQRDPGFDAAAVHPNLLDTGNYPTKPRDPLGQAGSVKEGRRAEARRVAENTVLPFQVDPALNHPAPAWVVKDEGALGYLLNNDAIAVAANDHKFVAGYHVSAANADYKTADRSLTNTVAVFGTAADAAAAAPGIVTAANPAVDYSSKDPYPTTAATIPRHPGTRAWTHEESRTDKPSWQIVQAFTVRGPYLLVQTARAASVAASAELIAATLDQQGPLIDGFTPTPYDQLAALPLDPTGLWARLLVARDDNHVVMMGVYGPHGVLAFSDDPVQGQRVYSQTGVDLLGYDQSFVWRTRDAAAAQTLLDISVADYRKSGYQELSGVPGLPGSHCLREPEKFSGSSRKVHCLGTADRYVFDVDSHQEVDAEQQAAAQYLMLVAP